MGETREIADFIATTEYTDLPDNVIERSKWAICDYLAGAIAGSDHPDSELIANHVQDTMGGSSTTTLGHGTACLSGALLANGSFPLVIGAGDTFESVVIHPSPSVVPPIFAIAEKEGSSGRDLLQGYVVGMETIFRIGLALYPSHYKYWHGSGTIGIFGAAAAASSMLGFSTQEVQRTFGIAASFSSGLKKNLDERVRPLHTGHAAQIGVQAALLARQELTADSDIFEGKIGYGTAMSADYDPSAFAGGERWAVLDTMLKPYPSGFITHAAMEGLHKIISERELSPDDVEKINVEVDRSISELFIHDPEDRHDAELSLQYCLSLVLSEESVGPDEFTREYFETIDWEKYAEKVEPIVVDGLFNNDADVNHGARVTVHTTGGEEFTQTETSAPGGPSNPIDNQRLQKKFFDYTKGIVSQENAKHVFEAIQQIEQLESEEITEMIHKLR